MTKSRFWYGVAGAAAVVALSLGGCERVTFWSKSAGGQGGTGPSTGPVANPKLRADVLAAVATCATELYDELAAAAKELETATKLAKSTPNDTTKQDARAAWIKAVGLWQQAEVLQLGPAGSSTLPDGADLRDEVYSWPLVSRCAVDQAIVGKTYESTAFAKDVLINARGLAAAEYLLFYEGTDNGCSASTPLNTQGTWAMLSADELRKRKAGYAVAVALDVGVKARSIVKGWKTGGFADKLSGAGKSGSPYATDQLAFNAVSDGLFYLDKMSKDLKLGRPLGLVDCMSQSCPEAVESQFARVARDHVRNNLVGFRRVLAGCDAGGQLGFDDILVAVGAQDLAARMLADTDAAIAAADALQSADLVSSLASDRPGVEKLHAAIKKVTTALKTEFVSVLDLELPKSVEGDND